MLGERPFKSKNKAKIKAEILEKQPFVKKDDLREGWSENARNLVNKLIKRNPEGKLLLVDEFSP